MTGIERIVQILLEIDARIMAEDAAREARLLNPKRAKAMTPKGRRPR